MTLAIRLAAVLMVLGQVLDGGTFLWASTVLDLDLSQEGETNPVVRWLWGEAGWAGIILTKGLAVAWTLLMVRATLALSDRRLDIVPLVSIGRTRIVALTVLTLMAILGLTAAWFNTDAVLTYGGLI